MPVKITVQVCEPLDWSEYGPECADDPEVVGRCYAELLEIMQSTLTQLAESNPYPLLSRIRSLVPGFR
jgi:hypothetical protein